MQATQTGRERLFDIGSNCRAVARADHVALLVDGEAYFNAVVQACRQAQRSIVIVGWDFDSRAATGFDAAGQPTGLLGNFLNELARTRRRLHIRILNWDYPMVFGLDRELSPAYGLSTWKPHRRVVFEYDNTQPVGGSHHQKIVVIDDRIAFVGGFDLCNRRWDSREHAPDDPRRQVQGTSYPPFHDIMMMFDGEAAQVVGEIARTRWELATGERLPARAVLNLPWPAGIPVDMRNVELGIACTFPPTASHAAVRDVEQLYLDMIARAQRYIYIENQYFTSATIGAALARRLAEPDGPEVFLVTRLLSHGWLEEMTMHVLRNRLLQQLRAADHGGRFHACYPHRDGLAAGTCIDVHSKMMAVDDQWLRIGSSNISNRSMGLDTECDIVVDAGENQAVRARIRRFRDELLAEHTGVDAKTVAEAIEQHGSMAAAVATLGHTGHQLRTLEETHHWPEAMVSSVAFADPEQPVAIELFAEAADDVPDAQREIARDERPRPAWPNLVAILVLIAGLALAWRYTPLASLASVDNVTAMAKAFARHWWAPVVLVLVYTPMSFVMFPRPLVTSAAVIAFGAWGGLGIAMSGLVLSSVVHYLIGRLLSRRTVRRLGGARLDQLVPILRRHGLLAMTMLRLVPAAPFPVLGIAAGALRIRLWHLAAGTFLGMLPGALAATVFAEQLNRGLRNGFHIDYWIVGLAAFVLVGMSALAARWFKKVNATHDSHRPTRRWNLFDRRPRSFPSRRPSRPARRMPMPG
ncbi:VTT domain-containing protein [Uliginosibacterium sp. sgz301328]|uniref:VTT domain-containing protein n=1 Tax=Uliginosibacterium sp. sgz301328 TaxID=3243764 RepID=UPI00359CEF8C